MKKILTDKRVIVVVVILILVLLLLNFNQRMVLLSKLRSQVKTLTVEYAQLEATHVALQTQIAYANSDKAVEGWAREQAGMILEGDIPIVVMSPSTPVPTQRVESEPTVDEVENWEIWQELFFGD
jgi:cell division protein FtsB